ncbi:MAG: YfhO family protein [Treponema sp.]|nr:YfhO family protein [Treponema sp.]
MKAKKKKKDSKNKRERIEILKEASAQAHVQTHVQILEERPDSFIYRHRYLILSFFLPVFIQGAMFALHRVFPFGNRQALTIDFFQAYYPYLSNFWHKIRSGTLAPWSWSVAGGSEYIAFYAYYLASPLNLLTLLTPYSALREMTTLILVFKIGFAGLFMAMYLQRNHGSIGLALPFFSSLYALCAFTLGFYWNIIWFDSFALLPLVILGLEDLMEKGKYTLYVISLALAVFANFYIGFYICIFVAISFVNNCIRLGGGIKKLLQRFGLVALFSGIAIGLTAIILVPTFFALQKTFTAGNRFTDEMIAIHYYFQNVFGNFIAFTPPTTLEGLPNIYSGMISLMFAGLLYFSKEISFREKLIFTGTMIIMILSANLNVLHYAWNGFRYTNQIPFRFSFLISFTLIAGAFRAYTVTKKFDKTTLLIMGISAGIFLLSAIFGTQQGSYIFASVVLSAAYLLILYFTNIFKTGKMPLALNIIFLLIITAELSGSSYIGIQTAHTSIRNEYPDRHRDIQTLLAMRERPGANFYRTEFAERFTMNDPSLYRFDGLSFFSSTINVSTTRFMVGLGLPSSEGNNRILYMESSPLTNAFLNLRYLISRDGNAADTEIYWETIGREGDSLLLENTHYLPLGFMVNEDLASYIPLTNPFLSKNDLFRRATGISESLFSVSTLDSFIYVLREDSEGNFPLFLEWSYEMSERGALYTYFSRQNTDTVEISVDTNLIRSADIRIPYTIALGNFEGGEVITLLASHGVPIDVGASMELPEVIERVSEMSDPDIQIAHFNHEVFRQGFNILAREPLVLTEFSSTRVAGNITSREGGLLYTSIPTDGNWRAFVNGRESEIITIGGAMAGLRLEPGSHHIEFRYHNNLLTLGSLISLASLVIFVLLILLDRYRRRRLIRLN